MAAALTNAKPKCPREPHANPKCCSIFCAIGCGNYRSKLLSLALSTFIKHDLPSSFCFIFLVYEIPISPLTYLQLYPSYKVNIVNKVKDKASAKPPPLYITTPQSDISIQQDSKTAAAFYLLSLAVSEEKENGIRWC